jgi:hypothetical protein
MQWTSTSDSPATPVGRVLQDLIEIRELGLGRLDRQLGYFGEARYCMFYFDQCADGLMWMDGHGYGFGSGAWRAFADRVEPLAPRYGVTLGRSQDGGGVLLIDRREARAYFADWPTAEALISTQGRSMDRSLRDERRAAMAAA